MVPFNNAAISCLDDLSETKDWPKEGFVFSHKPGRPIAGFSKMKQRLDAKIEATGEKVRPWRLHDLRRTLATNMQRLGVRVEVTEAILNHASITQAGVASVYQRHDGAEEKRSALDMWGKKMIETLDEWAEERGLSSSRSSNVS